ncbi:MAG TPA: lytic transglycosylase domain-containing protein [Vicinamibacterales bacterium]|nr:lytic transglycosylase domain-containing protein [Vicinamibacterales bacterium]
MKRALLATIVVLLFALPARAEIVFFSTGRTLSIKDHTVDPTDDGKLILTLRSGGEIVCEPSVIDRIVPDEVPYPEPEAEKPALVAVAAVPAAPVKYGEIIDKVSAEQNVSAKLVRAVIQVESAYHERARSPKGAMGLMQLMPATAKQYAVADPFDPAANIEGGVKHLKSLMQRLPVALALAAYNAGEAAVQRFNGIPPYRETQDYVARILRLAGL